MKIGIRCEDCGLMKIIGRAQLTRKNSHMVGTRGKCFCTHVDAEAAFHLICGDSNAMPGFIAFTAGGSDKPKIKTAPRWCPRKLLAEPKEVSKPEAYEIVTHRIPRGLFFLHEGNGYTGIDNRCGEAWTEEFENKASCLRWLEEEDHEAQSESD